MQTKTKLNKTKLTLAVGTGLAALVVGFGMSARPAAAFSPAAAQSHLTQSVLDRDDNGNNNGYNNNNGRNNGYNNNNGRYDNGRGSVNLRDYRRAIDRDSQRRRREEELRLERQRAERRRQENRDRDNRNRDNQNRDRDNRNRDNNRSNRDRDDR